MLASVEAAAPRRQHLIDPETCIRCNTCESRCPTGAIRHERNYVVDPDKCNSCLRCVRPCPTGAVDHWFELTRPFSIDEQLTWTRLPNDLAKGRVTLQAAAAASSASASEPVTRHGEDDSGVTPRLVAKPQEIKYSASNPAKAIISGNMRITAASGVNDVHHIVFEFGAVRFSYLEGQSVGVIPPGRNKEGEPYAMRLYSVASARDGERPDTNNMALAVKRIVERGDNGDEIRGVASNWLCDLPLGAEVEFIGPFGTTFLMPDDPDAHLLMMCTGAGVSPFRGFTHRRRRTFPNARGKLILIFGARAPEELPYFGPLQKYAQEELHRELVFSRTEGSEKEYVQDRLRAHAREVAWLMRKDNSYFYVCGLRGLEDGVEQAFQDVAREYGIDWAARREEMLRSGRYHVETY